MAARGELPAAWRGLRPHTLTTANAGARVGVGDSVEGAAGGGDDFDRFVEIGADEFFKIKKPERKST
ncbi:MAG: hypothetical protein KGL35_13180 [Bradyrhizobium sp.]|nr:hypothetical protein [Bradyrhizobium sp.]